jgi:N-methylhydantoinase B
LFGGKEAAGPDFVVNPGREDELHKLKINNLQLKPGDVVKFYTGGGGGFGNPWERDPNRVREDVIDRYITRQDAESDYGVVFRDDLSVDEEATRTLRLVMAQAAA